MELDILLAELEKINVRISVIDGDLKLQAPRGVISPELQKELANHKSEIIRIFSEKPAEKKQFPGFKMDFSLFFFASDDTVNPDDKYQLLIEGTKFADNNRFKAVWIPERHFHKLGGLFPNPAVIASALAMISSNIRLRAGSVVLPLHDPIRVAEEWAVVDNLSKGRVELSFASGWHINDFVLAPDNYQNRKKIMFEQAVMVRDLWRGIPVTRKSGAGNEIEIMTRPRPLQAELPIWITAIGNPETYAEAGKIGANLMTCLLDQDINEMAEKIKIYKNALEKNGFSPGSRKIALFAHTFLGAELEQVREKVRKPFTEYLKSTLDLLGKFGESAGVLLDPRNMATDEQEVLLDFAFNRYFSEKALMGTAESCQGFIHKLKEVGIDEIACLIDFGLGFNDIMAGLNHLKDVSLLYK
jgi:natural product biosynthesis luciferase-like monooxygenase protein